MESVHSHFTEEGQTFHPAARRRPHRPGRSWAMASRWLLERVKRPALRLLHRTRAGEAVLVRIYLFAEEHAERAVLLDDVVLGAPAWLSRWLSVHREEEARHAQLFRHHLRELGVTPKDAAGRIDPVSRYKLWRLLRLVRASAGRFDQGALVPALIVAGVMEEMGARVFARHVEVLQARGAPSPLLEILRTALADERRHARACARSVEKLTWPSERDAAADVYRRAHRIERQFGVTGALLLLFTGAFLCIRDAIASSISRSPTPAGT